MKLAGIIILLSFLFFLKSLKQKSYFYNTLTFILVIMAIIQAPIFYYYTSGMLSIFLIAIYLMIGVGLTIYLLLKLIKKENYVKNRFLKYGLICSIFLGIISLFWGSVITENIDWKIRLNSRKEIVEKIKKEDIKTTIYKLDKWDCPPISNGGNEISIEKGLNSEITVMFYIDRGFIDHYTAFVYANEVNGLKNLSSHYTKVKQLENNWYRVAK